MPSFPILKTGAVAQYPMTTAIRFVTQDVRFLDGSRQTYSMQGNVLRNWRIQLDRLDAQEAAGIAQFVEAVQGAGFAFPDPVTGTNVLNCVFDAEEQAMDSTGEMRAGAVLVVRETR